MSTIKMITPLNEYNFLEDYKSLYTRNPKRLLEATSKELFHDKYRVYATLKKDITIEGFDYLPKLHIVRNKYLGKQAQLYIEVSIAKCLFGNNYEEWTDVDLEKFVKWVISVLKAIGIEITENSILNARISKIHFAKNFIFPDKQTFKLFFEILEKIKYPWLKGKAKIYPNGGISYCYYSDIFSILFYDKLSELSIKHPELVGKLRANGINYVLRAEIQVNDRQKLKKLMGGLNFDGEITLATMFKIKRLITVFNKVFINLHKQAPYFYNRREETSTELFKSIKANSISERKDIFLILNLLKENDMNGVKKLILDDNMMGGKRLIKKYNIDLTSNPYIPNIFLKLLSIVKEYEPIQHSKFDEQKFIDFKI